MSVTYVRSMGRGVNSNPKAASLAGRYDLMPYSESERTADGRPLVDHIADVKMARLAMINVLDALDPAGLTTDQLRSHAISAGAPKREVVMAQVQLIRQHVIVKDDDDKWHISTSRNLVERWRTLSAD